MALSLFLLGEQPGHGLLGQCVHRFTLNVGQAVYALFNILFEHHASVVVGLPGDELVGLDLPDLGLAGKEGREVVHVQGHVDGGRGRFLDVLLVFHAGLAYLQGVATVRDSLSLLVHAEHGFERPELVEGAHVFHESHVRGIISFLLLLVLPAGKQTVFGSVVLGPQDLLPVLFFVVFYRLCG